MKKIRVTIILAGALGILTFALGAFIVNTFFIVERPERGGIIEDWEQICVWQDEEGSYVTISPRGCYSTTCTQVKQQTGTAVLDVLNQEIHLTARFMLLITSRFPFPCVENCSGGGRVQFKFDNLVPNKYTLWFLDQKVGEVNITTWRTNPRQCFENPLE